MVDVVALKDRIQKAMPPVHPVVVAGALPLIHILWCGLCRRIVFELGSKKAVRSERRKFVS